MLEKLKILTSIGNYFQLMSLHEPNEYNEYIGQETVDCEYKEFTFNLAGLILDTKLAEHYCSTNLFEFNKNVIFNLKKYFKVYLGKYACGYFWN